MIRVGDKMTISGAYLDKPNPAWRWWAFWRPRRVASSELQTYRVVAASDRPLRWDVFSQGSGRLPIIREQGPS